MLALLLVNVCNCGAEVDTVLLLAIDSRAVVPTPTSLHITLIAPSGDTLSHVSPVDAEGETRVALIAGPRTPASGAIEVLGYASREVVGRAGPTQYELVTDDTTTLTLALE